MKLAKLLFGRPAAPSGALIRAMKGDVSAIFVAVMSGGTSSGSRAGASKSRAKARPKRLQKPQNKSAGANWKKVSIISPIHAMSEFEPSATWQTTFSMAISCASP